MKKCLLFFLLFASMARAETIEEGISKVKSAVIRGDTGTVLRRVSIPSIISWVPIRSFRSMLAEYMKKEIIRMMRTGAGTRAAAANSFKVRRIDLRERNAFISASYSVPGAAEGVGITAAQNKNDEWIVVGVNSGILRIIAARLLVR